MVYPWNKCCFMIKGDFAIKKQSRSAGVFVAPEGDRENRFGPQSIRPSFEYGFSRSSFDSISRRFVWLKLPLSALGGGVKRRESHGVCAALQYVSTPRFGVPYAS